MFILGIAGDGEGSEVGLGSQVPASWEGSARRCREGLGQNSSFYEELLKNKK